MGKRRRPFSKKRAVERSFLYFVLIAGAAVCMLPLVWMLSELSHDVRADLRAPSPPRSPSLQMVQLWGGIDDTPLGRYFVNSIAIVVLVIVGTVITSSLWRQFARINWRGRDLVFSLIVATMMLPYAVTLIPTFVGWSAVRLTNTFGPLIIPAWFGGGAFYIFLLRQFYRGIPRELDEAARIDGANHVQIYSHIMVPLTKTSLIVVGLFAFLNTWNDFLGPLVYLNSSNKYTLALGLMQFTGMYKAEWHLMMAAATVVVNAAILIFLVGQRYFIEGIALTGIKG